MLKIIITLATIIHFAPTNHTSENSLYDIHFQSHNKGAINMGTYAGKQILVAVVSAATSDIEFLKSLDTLYRNRQGQLVIMAIPVMDLGSSIVKNDMVLKLSDSLGLNYIIVDTSYAKDGEHTIQPLIDWLSDKDLNKHFNGEIKYDGEMFIINGSGEVYAKLNKRISPTGIKMQRILDHLSIRD